MAVADARVRADDRDMTRVQPHRVRTLMAGVLALSFVLSLGFAIPTAARRGAEADRVISAAIRHLGKPYRWAQTGPNAFDCSGLVYRAFRQARLARRIGGFNTAHGYNTRFTRRGRTSRHTGRPGDIVVYNHGQHVGIYLGKGRVISATLSGVRRHPLRGLNIRFTRFLHVRLRSGASVRAGNGPEIRKADRGLAVRAKPRRQADRVLRIPKRSTLRVLGSRRNGGDIWIKVRLSSGEVGWVRKAYTRPG